MDNQKMLVLSFINTEGQEMKINIRSPAKEITDAQVSEIMERIVTLGAFTGNSSATVRTIGKAYFINKVSTPVDLS